MRRRIRLSGTTGTFPQVAPEQDVAVCEHVHLRLRAQRLSQSVACLSGQADAAGSKDHRGHENVKLVHEIGFEECRERRRAPFHEDAPEPALHEGLKDRRRIEGGSVVHRHHLDAVRQRRGNDGPPPQDKTARAIFGKAARRGGDAAGGIDHNPRRTDAGDAAHRQQRIVRADRSHPHHDRIHRRPQGVQVIEGVGAVDIFRIARGRGDAPVQGLAELGDDMRAESGRLFLLLHR